MADKIESVQTFGRKVSGDEEKHFLVEKGGPAAASSCSRPFI
jgi:hypothetical protein